jgi:hypothetical protein
VCSHTCDSKYDVDSVNCASAPADYDPAILCCGCGGGTQGYSDTNPNFRKIEFETEYLVSKENGVVNSTDLEDKKA